MCVHARVRVRVDVYWAWHSAPDVRAGSRCRLPATHLHILYACMLTLACARRGTLFVRAKGALCPLPCRAAPDRLEGVCAPQHPELWRLPQAAQPQPQLPAAAGGGGGHAWDASRFSIFSGDGDDGDDDDACSA
jgi:hypothetical protein